MASQSPDSGFHPPTRDPRKVFVAYGRNLEARDAMFMFLQALGLNPLDWPQLTQLTGEGSPGIERAVNSGLDAAQGYLVLLTPDELVEVRPGLTPSGADADRGYQPRPNVLVELGQALATDAERTLIVSLGVVRPLSNIAGRYVLRMDNSAAKRHELKLKLETVKLKVVEGSQGWLSPKTGGDFDGALAGLRDGSWPTEQSDASDDHDDGQRRVELIAQAKSAFVKWVFRSRRRRGTPRYDTGLYRDWVRSGYVPDYDVFDYEMSSLTADAITVLKKGRVNCPLRKEHAADVEKGRQQQRTMLESGTYEDYRDFGDLRNPGDSK